MTRASSSVPAVSSDRSSGTVASEAGGGPARAALIDEDQVAVAARRLERAAQLQIEVDGALPGPAGDQEQRIGPRLGARAPRSARRTARSSGRPAPRDRAARRACRSARRRPAASRPRAGSGPRSANPACAARRSGGQSEQPRRPSRSGRIVGIAAHVRAIGACPCQRHDLSILGGQAAPRAA